MTPLAIKNDFGAISLSLPSGAQNRHNQSNDERLIKARRVNPKNIFTELKRRNVYRAAVAYGVVAWFLTQLTTQVFPFFEVPSYAVRFVVIALAVGFPIAMLLSWVYEFTPEGVVRTEDLDPAQAKSAQRATGRILDFVIIGVSADGYSNAGCWTTPVLQADTRVDVPEKHCSASV